MGHDGAMREEPAEHLRFAAYLHELEQVSDAAEADLVSAVLTDPDLTMARSAVLRHLDRRAMDLHLGPAYEQWAESMARTTLHHPLLGRRLREWTLFRAIELGQSWRPDALLAASDWLQRKAAAASNADAVELLAEHGRTKRIRNTARAGLQHGRQH
ncbi:hypothetical protein [Streptomyces sp. NPDC059010]|uniref:hypothetical protein n=1 Tax=Streptomyces sp. NPDC059010 TaxID=3346695 RepID=UPI0036CD75D5